MCLVALKKSLKFPNNKPESQFSDGDFNVHWEASVSSWGCGVGEVWAFY